MKQQKLIVIGGSAGGIEALKDLIAALPAHLPAALFVVIHFPPSSVSYLAEILNRKGVLPAHLAKDGEAIEPGKIYVSVPDYHLIVHRDHVYLTRDARENHNRPAIDVLFRTAAQFHGANVIGVVLSGLLNDGTAGLLDIKKHGGTAIVQDPATAAFGDMPQSAIRHVPGVDWVLSPQDIARKLVELTTKSQQAPAATAPIAKPSASPVPEQEKESKMTDDLSALARSMVTEGLQIVAEDTAAQEAGQRDGLPSIYSCPDCGGVLWQINDDGFVRFRCHVGHAFSAESLLHQQSEVLESALWYALRTIIDKAKLARQLAENARERGREASVAHFESQAESAEHYARVMRQIIETGSAAPLASPSAMTASQ